MATLALRTTNKPAHSKKPPITMDPDSYVKNNGYQRKLNLQVMELMRGSFTEETKEQQFLDLGCGTGDFTRDYLLPLRPNVGRIVAVDVSQDMVEHAKRKFAHPKICYDVLDIGGSGVTDFVGRYGQFDRVYSFFCLHWIGNQERAFKNIADLMRPGGECLLYFLASVSFMRLGKKLLTLDRWQKYRTVLPTHSPTLDLTDRDARLSYISGLLKNANLIPTTCEVLEEDRKWSSVEQYTRGTCESRCLESGVSTDPEPCGFARPRLAVRGFPVSGEKGILVVEPSPG
ncbi:juvenile hormone acid O-methyltransferase [Ixodes scapularis]